MKGFLLVVLVVFSAAFAHAQSCLKFKNGTFKTMRNGKSLIIKRSGKFLREDSAEPRASVSYTLNWTDDCTYTLRPNEDYYQRFPNMPKTMIVTVHLSNIGANTYTQMVTNNDTKEVLTSLVTKIY